MSKYKTEQRKKLISLFENNPHQTFSAQDIATFFKDDGISLSAIYRNLSEMINEEILCKVSEKKRSGTLYQYIDPVHCAGVIHFKCQSCDNTFHLNRAISQMIINVAKEEFAFSVNGSAAFLYGKCDKCSQKHVN